MRYGNNSPFNDRPSCGYLPCSCVGVQFISRGGTPVSTDYCVNGKRMRFFDGQPLPRAVFIYRLEKYADYLRWHQKNRERYELGSPEAFEYVVAA